jgi:hypothetical protein
MTGWFVDTAASMCAAARLLGWEAIVGDARAKFATPERVPSASRIVVEWPEETLAQVQPDHATAIVILTHDDKFDLPALELALASDAFYVGLIGGRRNQEKKRDRLRELGVDETSIERIAGPCGLDIGADATSEVALSILAEAVAAGAGARRFAQPLDAADPRRGGMKTRAAVMREPGQLRVEEIELEEPLPGEVVVRMSAVASAHRSALVQGRVGSAHADRARPRGAGLIEAVGGEANGLKEGDRVVSPGRLRAANADRVAAGGRPLADRSRPRSGAGRCSTAVPACPRRRDRLPRHRNRRPRGAVVVAAAAAMPFGDDVPWRRRRFSAVLR